MICSTGIVVRRNYCGQVLLRQELLVPGTTPGEEPPFGLHISPVTHRLSKIARKTEASKTAVRTS
jgi:hypothetical protein